MTAIASISLKDCKLFAPWGDAPNGSFLQMLLSAKDSEPIVGLKFEFQYPGRPVTSKCLLRFEDKHNGQWIFPSTDYPAIDVSAQIELHTAPATPRSLLGIPLQFGFIYGHRDGSIFIRAHNAPQASQQVEGYVCVKGSGRYPAGILQWDLPPLEIYELGQATLKHTVDLPVPASA